MKGFVYAHEAEVVTREASKVFSATVEEFLQKPDINLDEMRQNVYEKTLKAVRRCTGGKEPMLLPLIVEAE